MSSKAQKGSSETNRWIRCAEISKRFELLNLCLILIILYCEELLHSRWQSVDQVSDVLLHFSFHFRHIGIKLLDPVLKLESSSRYRIIINAKFSDRTETPYFCPHAWISCFCCSIVSVMLCMIPKYSLRASSVTFLRKGGGGGPWWRPPGPPRGPQRTAPTTANMTKAVFILKRSRAVC